MRNFGGKNKLIIVNNLLIKAFKFVKLLKKQITSVRLDLRLEKVKASRKTVLLLHALLYF